MKEVTIGYFTTNLAGQVMQQGWRGIVDAARHHNIRLVTFAGGLVESKPDHNPANIAFRLFDPDLFDGLIIHGSSVLPENDPKKIRDFLNLFPGLPVVSCAGQVGDIPYVSVGRYQGVYDMVTHLIRAHGHSQIVYIHGPKSYSGAEDRLNGYRDALIANQIPFQDKLITPPIPTWFGSQEQIDPLIDLLLYKRGLQPGKDFTAVVADTDEIAIRTIDRLNQEGISVPENVAVAGFNDIPESSLCFPPLSTVHPPFYEKGWKTLELLLGMIRGESCPQHINLPSQLIIRQSCGCPNLVVNEVGTVTSEQPILSGKTMEGENITLNSMFSSDDQMLIWQKQVEQYFLCCLQKKTDDLQMRHVERLFHQIARKIINLPEFQSWLTHTQQSCEKNLLEAEKCSQAAQNFWHRLRIIAGESVQRLKANEALQHEQQMIALHQIGQNIRSAFDINELVDQLAQGLSRVGIQDCFLSLYENPLAYQFPDSPPEWCYLKFAFSNREKIKLPPGGVRYRSCEILPEPYNPARRVDLVVEPLYLHGEQLGFLTLAVGTYDGTVYEVLRSQMSSALRGILLFDETKQARIEAEKADLLKTRLLANVSHELRNPLNVIMGLGDDIRKLAAQPGEIPSGEVIRNIDLINSHAEHQKRVINDLLDLSRAEIGELDLVQEWIDPRSLIIDAFESVARSSKPGVAWRLQMQDVLPVIFVDPMRLRQILLNLLSNAVKFIERGEIELGAQVDPPHLHIWIKDTGPGIPPRLQEKIFEPFANIERTNRRLEGVGLGLSITRRLVSLHKGAMRLESAPGRGSIFHVYLPLPALAGEIHISETPHAKVVLMISSDQAVPQDVQSLATQNQAQIVPVSPDQDIDQLFMQFLPVAIAWDSGRRSTDDWKMLRRLRNHPRAAAVPFVFYSSTGEIPGCAPDGMTGYLVKPENRQNLFDVIQSLFFQLEPARVLIVDDDPAILSRFLVAAQQALPESQVEGVSNGMQAVEAMQANSPNLVLLDLTMPGMDGFDVLDWMRTNSATRCTPVLILSNRTLNREDVERLQKHAQVTMQTKGILSDQETLEAIHRALMGDKDLPVFTSALVKRTIAYIQTHYPQPITRAQMAELFGVSEDYLSRVFSREMGMPTWEYLKRYRILAARELLLKTNIPIESIGRQVGFEDAAYFSRIFSQVTGVSPRRFRARGTAK